MTNVSNKLTVLPPRQIARVSESQYDDSWPILMTDIQRLILNDYLRKPIRNFDIVIDDSIANGVGNRFFGELAYKDPVSGDIHVIDTSRQYCLLCIVADQKLDPSTPFETSNMYFFDRKSTNGSTELMVTHLQNKHNKHVLLNQSDKSPSNIPISVGTKRPNQTSTPRLLKAGVISNVDIADTEEGTNKKTKTDGKSKEETLDDGGGEISENSDSYEDAEEHSKDGDKNEGNDEDGETNANDRNDRREKND